MTNAKTVLFLGGSVTCGCNATAYERAWASLVYSGISGLLPEGSRMVNASLSGTGSFLAAMRLGEHVLPHKPDIAFIEYSINDYFNNADNHELIVSSLDYIVRKLSEVNPNVVIFFVYTTTRGHNVAEIYHPVAEHYGIREFDLQTPMLAEIGSGHDWDEYFTDPAHPNDAGHKFYADIILRGLLAEPALLTTPVRRAEALAKLPLSDPHIVPAAPDTVVSHDGFTYGLVSDDLSCKHLPELAVDHAYYSRTPGAQLVFKFSGTSFGLYHRLSQSCGICELSIDGEPAGEYSFFHDYGPEYQGPGEFLCFAQKSGLAPGEHTATITVTGRKAPQSGGIYIMIAGFLVG